jgi:putative lipoprotein
VSGQLRDRPANAEPGHAPHVESPAHLPADGPLVVTGAVTYRQRVALPPRSVVTVTVDDTSHADAPARTVGRSVIDAHAHQVPVPFEVVVDRAELDPHTRLALRARIDGPDGLLWVSDTHIPVPLDGSAEPFTVPLVHVTGHPR